MLLDDDDEIKTTTIDPTGDSDLDQFTILAFVLIGTVIGCLCVIVVTTIICCICWHEHQIKAINMNKQDSIKNTDDINPSNIQREKTTPSPPGSSPPSPKSLPHENRKNINDNNNNNNNNNYYRSTKSQSPESNAINSTKRKKKRQNSHSYQQAQHKGSYDDDDNNNNNTNSPRQKYNRKGISQRRGSKKTKKGHTKTGSRSTNTTNMSSSSYQIGIGTNPSSLKDRSHNRRSHSSQTRKIEDPMSSPQQQQSQQHQHQHQHQHQRQQSHSKQRQQQKSSNSGSKKKRKQTYDEENDPEADDDIGPLANDRLGQMYDENGNFDKYKNRKANKEEIRMALAAFPSTISAGTTGTEEMNFVGSNYDGYNPNNQINSYFKEDYEHNPVGGYGSDNLSLGNLDSGTTITSSIAPSSIAPSSIAPSSIAPSSVAMVSPTQHQQGQQYYQHRHQQHQHQHQHQQQQQQQQHYQQQYQQQQQQQQQQYRQKRNNHRHQPNNIKIIEPQAVGKVRAKHRNIMNNNHNDDDASPTLTYTSGNDPPMPQEVETNQSGPDTPNTTDSPHTNQRYRD